MFNLDDLIEYLLSRLTKLNVELVKATESNIMFSVLQHIHFKIFSLVQALVYLKVDDDGWEEIVNVDLTDKPVRSMYFTQLEQPQERSRALYQLLILFE